MNTGADLPKRLTVTVQNRITGEEPEHHGQALITSLQEIRESFCSLIEITA
jgi:hypothetical protein